MTPQETEQVAALRMHVAHLVNALKATRENVRQQIACEELGVREANLVMGMADAALEQSEPGVRDLLAEADRDAKLKACREQLAGTTARLAVLEGKAREVIRAWNSELEPMVVRHAVETSVDGLEEALK